MNLVATGLQRHARTADSKPIFPNPKPLRQPSSMGAKPLKALSPDTPTSRSIQWDLRGVRGLGVWGFGFRGLGVFSLLPSKDTARIGSLGFRDVHIVPY